MHLGERPAPLTEPVRGEAGERLRGPAKSVAKKKTLTRRALAALDKWISETRTSPLAAE